jgi:hypothetical protein
MSNVFDGPHRLKPDEAEFLANLIADVRRRPTRYREGAALLDEQFSSKAMRHERAVELVRYRSAQESKRCPSCTAQVVQITALTARKHTDHLVLNTRVNPPRVEKVSRALTAKQLTKLWPTKESELTFPPGNPMRRSVLRQHFPWGRRDGVLRVNLRASLEYAVEWVGRLPSTMRGAEAQAACLLAWLLFDDAAPAVPMRICAMQALPWDGWAEHGGEPYQGRQPVSESCLGAEMVGIARQAWLRLESQSTGHAVDVTHAPDFSWLQIGGQRHDFKTTRQRQIIEKLYGVWCSSGGIDGSGLTEIAIAEAIGASGTAIRLRIDKTFECNPVLGTILRRASRGVWALYLRDPNGLERE